MKMKNIGDKLFHQLAGQSAWVDPMGFNKCIFTLTKIDEFCTPKTSNLEQLSGLFT